MFDTLLRLSAANNLVTGLRVGPHVSGHYQIHIWVGPRAGDRYEWFEKFDIAVNYDDAINAVAGRAIVYCIEHWNCRSDFDEVTAA